MKVPGAFLVLLAPLCLSGCGDGDLTGPEVSQRVAAYWKLTINTTCGGQWWDRVRITQQGDEFRGAGETMPVSLEGTVSGKLVTIRFTFGGTCPGAVSGSGTINLDGITGTFENASGAGPGCCAAPSAGAFVLHSPE